MGGLAAGNHRNGYSHMSVTLDDERVVLDIPRDRNGPFDPLLFPKYARRIPGFDDSVIAWYARSIHVGFKPSRKSESQTG